MKKKFLAWHCSFQELFSVLLWSDVHVLFSSSAAARPSFVAALLSSTVAQPEQKEYLTACAAHLCFDVVRDTGSSMVNSGLKGPILFLPFIAPMRANPKFGMMVYIKIEAEWGSGPGP